jgi:homocysteine S-methyltransferase
VSGFARRLADGSFPIALEITPPRTLLPQVLLRRARVLGRAAAAVNPIQRPDRLSSLEASRLLLEAGHEPVWHLLARGRSRDEVDVEIERARALGLRCVLCIRGEHDAADKSDTPRVRELVGAVCEALPEALVGATLNPYSRRERTLANLLRKLDAGASYVQTQPIFDARVLEPWGEAIRAHTPRVRIVPMVIPLRSSVEARRLGARTGAVLPPALLDRLDAHGAEAGWAALSETLHALRASPFADGVAVMTLRADPTPDTAARLRALLVR